MINNILSSLNNKLLIGGLFCDLQKAFHSLNHEILLSKMRFYAISGVANKLIKSYLQDRYQRVLINIWELKYFSEWEQVQHGIPQGSILVPLLFLLHINNLSKIISDKSNSVSLPMAWLLLLLLLLLLEIIINLGIILIKSFGK